MDCKIVSVDDWFLILYIVHIYKVVLKKLTKYSKDSIYKNL